MTIISTHPAWCEQRACQTGVTGAHLSSPTALQLADGDLQASVRTGLWAAERDQPALPGVRLTMRHRAYPDPPTEAFLSPDDAALLALSLLAAAAKAGQP